MGWKSKKLEAIYDEDFYDVHLVGTDGEEVPCCKTFLATTSPVFKSMFFRGFKEQTSDRCSLDFHSLVISLIVKYCYCGEVDMEPLEEEASLLVELRVAGRYLDIEELSSTAEAKIANLVFEESNDNIKYQYASAFLTELFKRDEDEEPLGRAIYLFADKNTMECFGSERNNTGTYKAHPRVLSKVLKKTEDTYTVVRCIQTWFSLENLSTGNGYSDEEKQDLIEIAESVDLKRLPTEKLSDIKPCSLFSSERILEAFVHHCKSREIATETPRTEPRVHVIGAGMKHLDGCYNRMTCKGEKLNMFSLQVEHDGISCKSIIHFKHAKNRWLISITKNDEPVLLNRLDSGLEARKKSIQFHVYESACQSLPTEDTKIPPFNGWECIEGTGEAPYVACIYE